MRFEIETVPEDGPFAHTHPNTGEHFVALFGVRVRVDERAVFRDSFDFESHLEVLTARVFCRTRNLPAAREPSEIEHSILLAVLFGRHAVPLDR
jgi:hypothetical protein